MKILLSQKIAMLSGSEWHLLNLSSGLKKRGFDVHFLALIDYRSEKGAEDLIKMFENRGIKIHRIIVKRDYSISLFKKISNLIKEEKFDIIHTHLIKTDFIFSMTKAIFLPKMYLMATHHGFDEGYQFRYGFNVASDPFNLFIILSKFNQRFINANIAISHSLKNLFVSKGIMPENKVEVIHYGFSFNGVEYDEDISKYRKSSKQILIVGRLIDWKGHKYILSMMPDLIKKYGEDISLVIVGKGNYMDELVAYTKSLNIEKHVYFEGFSIKVHDYIKNSDVVAIPSTSEGFCVVLMEAYHSMGPLAIFDVPALNENIFHRETGMLAPPFNTEIFKNNIIELLDNPELRATLKINGKKYLENYLNLDRMTEQTIDFYNSKLKENNK